MSVNKVILIGNLGEDPQIRLTQDGKKIASFSVATNEYWKDKTTGERKSKTEWHRVVVFSDNIVSIVEKFLKKSSRVYLEGALQTRKWQDQAGVQKYSTEIILQGFSARLEMLDKRNDEDYGGGSNGSSGGGSRNESYSGGKTSTPKNDFSDSFDEDLGDDVPF